MATVHTCDLCKKPIAGERVIVDISNVFHHFEFCNKHGAPVLAVLKKYKLTT